MNSLRINAFMVPLAICGSMFLMPPMIHAESGQIDSFSAWCVPGKGAEYRYDRTKNRITSDRWGELDGSGFTGGAYIFQYSGGNDVTLGKQEFPIQARNGTVIMFSRLEFSPTFLRSDTFLIHTKLRKIFRLHAESFEFAREGRSILSTESTVMDCDWRQG